MIIKGELNENVMYLIVDKKDIGSHSNYITKLSRDCRVLKLNHAPHDKDEILYDKEYALYIEQIIKEVNWDLQVLFLIVCGENTTVSEKMAIKDDDIPLEEITEFSWQKPQMRQYHPQENLAKCLTEDPPRINWNVRINKPNRIKTLIERIFS